MAKSKLSLSKVCRGNQKIFALVEAPKGTASVTATSEVSGGQVVPAIIYPFRKRSSVLVLAVTEDKQTVTLVACDAEGVILATLTETIKPDKARRSSQLHTLAHDPVVKRIRNMDTDPHPNHFELELVRLVREEGTVPLDIVVGNATITTADADALTCPVEVSAIDRTGASISTHEVILSEATRSLDGDLKVRTVSFSFRVPFFGPEYLIWVKTPKGAYDLLYFLDFEERDKRQKWWRAWTMPVEDDSRYPEFFGQVWAASADELADQRSQTNLEPSVSLILVTDGSDLKATDETVESLIAETYENLEILISPTVASQALKDACARWSRRSEKVRPLAIDTETCTKNEALARALEAAQNTFCALVSDFDILAPDAIFRLADEVRKDDTVDVCYADEDMLNGKTHERPNFKPSFESDLLLCWNYLAHPLFFRKSLIEATDLLKRCPEGDLEHYLALVATHEARRVAQVPRVLYHARSTIDTSAAATLERVRAVEAALADWGVSARVSPNPRLEGYVEVDYDLAERPKVSVLIPNKDQVPILDRCVQSLLKKTSYDNFEVIIIENNSTDPETFAYYDNLVKADDRVRVTTYEGPFNFSAINNFGVKDASGSYLLFLNNDTEIIEGDWMRRMVSVCERPGTGIVGARLLYPNDTLQHAGVIMRAPGITHQMPYMPRNYAYWNVQLTQDLTCVTAACLMVKRSVFDQVEGFDEGFAVDYNDVDFCWRVYREGYKVVYEPAVELYHLESVSRGKHESEASKKLFQHEIDLLSERWPDHYNHVDPGSNPNIDQHSSYHKLNPLLLPQ